jgi:hypothetical protein
MIEIALDRLPLGDVPRDNTPRGEYHCLRPDPRYDGWDEPTNHWTWDGPNWRVAEDADGRFLEQRRASRYNNTLLLSAAVERGVRAAEVQVRCAAPAAEVGLVFACRTALDYLCLHLEGDRAKLSRRRGGQFDRLAESGPLEAAGRWIALGFALRRGRLVCRLDGGDLFTVRLGGGVDGRVGLLANVPARFRRLRAEGRPPRRPRVRRAAGYPPMKCLRRIPTPGFGTGRQIRFGDLEGDGRLGMVLAQPATLQVKQSYTVLGAMTALGHDGRVLWQVGEPAACPLVSADLPFQVHDIDGDGRAEVVSVRDFEVQVLDGATGRRKAAWPVPDAPRPDPLLAHVVTYFGAPTGEDLPKACIDAIAFADLRGQGAPRDVLLKDRYHHLWAYTAEGRPLWSFCGNLGHFPFAADINGDGRDEVAAGYHILSADGRLIENVHFGDHADAVYLGDAQGWGEPKVIRAGGDDGLLVCGLGGDVLQVRLGHVQRLSMANFRPDRPGLEYVVCTYWGAPGIVALIDSSGKIVWVRKYPVCGNTLQPVNWTGDGRELIYFSAHPAHGGLHDADGEPAVRFPDDGHPERCGEVVDFFGTGRDNLVVWDPGAIWIYGPRGDAPAQPRYAPRRPPLYNASNYMAYWSIPHGASPGAR